MTVRELIDRLASFDGECEVLVNDGDRLIGFGAGCVTTEAVGGRGFLQFDLTAAECYEVE